jgi:hypothetical protein
MHLLTAGGRAFSPRATMLVAVAFGVLVGGTTALLQGVLPGTWNALANSSAVWLLCAAACGFVAPRLRWAALAGVTSLLAMLAGFYLTAIVARSTPESSAIAAIWTVAAVLGGPAYGVGGYWLRSVSDRARTAGVALIAGALIGEGIALLVVIHDFAGFAIGEFITAGVIYLFGPFRPGGIARSATATALVVVVVFAMRAAINSAITHL